MLIHISAATLDEGMQAFTSSFNERFQSVFPVPPSPKKDSIESFSKAITSNLIGGVGYFYGKSIVDKSFAYEWDEDDSFSAEGDAEDSKDKGDGGAHLTEPKALLTATPSRSFFPRGFYW